MKKLTVFLLCFNSLLFSGALFAEMIYLQNVKIKRLGSHNGQTFYLNLDKPFGKSCAYGLIYCPSNNEDCKNLYPLALSAKVSNANIPDFRYIYDESTQRCTAWLISVE